MSVSAEATGNRILFGTFSNTCGAHALRIARMEEALEIPTLGLPAESYTKKMPR